MWKFIAWVLLIVSIFVIGILVFTNIYLPTSQSDEISRIPKNTCPDKEFEGQGDGALYIKGKKYYTESEDWDWIVKNCLDYTKYKEDL